MGADALAPLLVIAALFAVVWFVAGPLRGGPREAASADAAERERLEATRDAKYREIRELDLDFRTGKLSEDEFRAQDRDLRGQAVAVLRELDALD
jgi:hypothetical protein